MSKLRLSWPNRITILRILLIVPFVIVMLHVNDPEYQPWARYAALAMFVVAAISDAVDGWLARRYRDITLLGKFLDPLADKLLITCTVLLLAAPSTALPGMKLPGAVVVIIIGKDLYTVLGFMIIYLVTFEMTIVPVRMGKLSTVLQLSMVIAILVAPDVRPHWPAYDAVPRVLWWAAATAAILTVVIYTRNGSRYITEYEHRQKARRQSQKEDAGRVAKDER
jgi:CDP-diacylglycerol--glycerol-3-phosphate 3-phosphatidyltransferase